eukprot:6208369-Pleurochrysis_carterae.AAC.1
MVIGEQMAIESSPGAAGISRSLHPSGRLAHIGAWVAGGEGVRHWRLAVKLLGLAGIHLKRLENRARDAVALNNKEVQPGPNGMSVEISNVFRVGRRVTVPENEVGSRSR